MVAAAVDAVQVAATGCEQTGCPAEGVTQPLMLSVPGLPRPASARLPPSGARIRTAVFHDHPNPSHSTLAIADRGGSSLFAGPIIAREILTAPRPLRYYLGRASFSCFLFILMWTAW